MATTCGNDAEKVERELGGGAAEVAARFLKRSIRGRPVRPGAARARGRSHTSAGEERTAIAVFMASDRASGMTGTTVNLTMGSLDD